MDLGSYSAKLLNGKRTKVVTVKMAEDWVERIDEYARKMGINRSEAIRLAIRLLLEGKCDEGI